MYCNKIKIKTFCLGILARLLAWIGKQLHAALDKLNSTWYRFLLYCLIEISKWPNQTMRELSPVTHIGVSIGRHALRQEKWVWMCEILIVTLLIASMVVPLTVVLIAAELITRRRVLRRNRVCNSRPFNIHALANL